MEKFTCHTGVAVPLDIANIDTDQIIPKQFLLSTTREGFGKYAFYDWRYLNDDMGQLNLDFNLNKAVYSHASILVAQDNFGSGSSREHAPWALIDYGFKVIIAPSFASIFNKNALNNGLLTVVLSPLEVEEIIRDLTLEPQSTISVDLEKLEVLVNLNQSKSIKQYTFTLDPFYRDCLLKGLDNIDLTLCHIDKISAYEKKSNTYLV